MPDRALVTTQINEEEMRDKALSCTVVSFIPWELNEEKPGLIPPRFKIEKSDGKIPTITHIRKAFHFVYLDETRGSLKANDPSDEVANSICNDFINAQLEVDDVAKPGIFWLPGLLFYDEIAKKYKERLDAVKEGQRRWFLNICRIADDDWNRYHKHNSVSDFQRTAARMLGWDPKEHLWMDPEVVQKPFEGKTTRCLACNTELEGEPVICKACGCILRPSEYDKMKFTTKKES